MAPAKHTGHASRKHVEVKDFQPQLLWRLGVFLVLSVTITCFDQIIKTFVRAAAVRGAFPLEFIPGIIGFDYVENRGASFGLGEGHGMAFVMLAIIMVAAALIYLLRAPLISKLEVIGLGMVAGGAVGNGIDRVVHGFVTDFISTRFVSFPTFNIADIGITVGVVVALVGFIFLSPANKEAAERAERDRASHGDSAIAALRERKRAARNKKGR